VWGVPAHGDLSMSGGRAGNPLPYLKRFPDADVLIASDARVCKALVLGSHRQ
jgi:hypothetical protein